MTGSAHERVWIFYLAVVIAVDVVFGIGRGYGEPLLHAGTHLALLAGVVAIPRLVRTPCRLGIARAGVTLIGLPFVFSSLAWILPALHPEPYEWRWIAVDRAIFGVDPSVWSERLLWPAFVEVLQWCYASFYFVPILAVATAARIGGVRAYERCLVLVTFGFLLSYLGYLLWPTLPPYHFLWHERPLLGVWSAESIHAALEEAELHRWNCFPSGHTMLSVLSLVLMWRHARRVFWFALPVVVLLVTSTIVLRYHYAIDVLAGLTGVPVALCLGDRILRSPGS